VRSAIRVLPTWNTAAAPMFIGFRTVGAPGTGRHHSCRTAGMHTYSLGPLADSMRRMPDACLTPA
jgi:hypothetical protein